MVEKRNKTDLHLIHDNLAKYFEDILKLHMDMMASLQLRFSKGDLKISEFNLAMQNCSLPPAVLTAISSFLKTNDIRVIPETLGKDLDDFEDSVKKMKAHGVSIKDCKLDADIN